MPDPRTAAPILCVTQIARSIRFYEQAFGFARPSYFDGNEDYVVIALGEAQIHLMASERANPNHAVNPRAGDPFVWVPSITPVATLAAAAGLVPQRGPARYDSTPVATEEVVFTDPDGYRICFGAVVAGSPR